MISLEGISAMAKFALNAGTIQTVDVETQLEATKAAGFSGFGLWYNHIANESGEVRKAIYKKMLRSGLEVVEVDFLRDWASTNSAGKADLVSRTRTLAEAARSVDSDLICAATLGEAASVKSTVNNFSLICRTAAEYDVRVGLEFLPWSHVPTLESAQEIIQLAAEKNAGIIIDTFHFFFGGSKLSTLSKMSPSEIFLVHISDMIKTPLPELQSNEIIALTRTSRVFPGDGWFPLGDFIEALKKIGYEGFYSLEVLNSKHALADPFSLAKQGFSAMERLFMAAKS
ncbi:sugar phosphate isomerase/epimerase family protein [Agrobacterium sp. NPDC090283]|uniref:sugar phosphate isomerase/epimerase family protein n=1 Tax=Agrobacterium sp. NPDC090283 TaxID=3363920 RepID=UPI00383ABAD3